MNYKVGEKLMWVVNDFDGHSENICVVFEVHNDYAIAKCDGMSLWIDKDTEKDFKKM